LRSAQTPSRARVRAVPRSDARSRRAQGDGARVRRQLCSAEESARIKAEAIELFGDAEGKLDLEALANGPRTAREEKQLRARSSERDDLLADW